MKRVLIVHGWGANSKSNWFPWLKRTLEKKGFEVYAPDLPNSIWPKEEQWIREIKKIARPFNDELTIVAHSLGTVVTLRLLEKLKEKEKINKVILVSGFTKDLGIENISDFFQKPFNWKKIKNKANEFIVIHSDDDEVVPIELGKELAEKLGVKILIEHNCGHLNAGIGNFTYPRILELVGDKNEN